MISAYGAKVRTGPAIPTHPQLGGPPASPPLPPPQRVSGEGRAVLPPQRTSGEGRAALPPQPHAQQPQYNSPPPMRPPGVGSGQHAAPMRPPAPPPQQAKPGEQRRPSGEIPGASGRAPQQPQQPQQPLQQRTPTPQKAPAQASHVMRFGEKAIELKVLTIEQVEEALAAQEDGRRRGIDRSIGAWLHDRGTLDLVQVQKIMTACGANAAGRVIPDIDLISLLGRGASGAVYRGKSLSMGIDVAAKIRAPRREADDPNAQRFKLEAKLGERLAHPNIVRLFSAGETRDYTYHVLEYVDGTALDVMLKAEGKLPEPFVTDIGVQICAALECAAREGIVHRDIKPANIMITNGGRAKLCDLGLAKDLNRGTALTADGVLLGSPFYLAPEYARTGEIEIRSDIYSLGVTLYHCATGYVPFPGKSAMEILQRVVRDTAADPRTYNPALTEPFAQAILRMMNRDPGARFQTPTEAKEGLMRLANAAAEPGSSRDTGIGRLLGFFKRK